MKYKIRKEEDKKMIIKTAEYYRVRRKNKRRKKNKNTINKKFVGNFKIKRKN